MVGVFGVAQELVQAWPTGATAADAHLGGTSVEMHRSWYRLPTVDSFVAGVFGLGALVLSLLWVAVVASVQYWTNLVCGAPARNALTKEEAPWRTCPFWP